MRIAGISIGHCIRTLKSLSDPLFCGYFAAWLLIHICRWAHYPIPLLNNWLTDFLFVPAVAHIALTLTQQLFLRNPAYRYPLHFLLLAALYVSIVFEIVLPRYYSFTTGDPVDVICYFAGALFYFGVHQRIK